MELKREIRKGMGVGMVLNKFRDIGQNSVFFFTPESLSFSMAPHTHLLEVLCGLPIPLLFPIQATRRVLRISLIQGFLKDRNQRLSQVSGASCLL